MCTVHHQYTKYQYYWWWLYVSMCIFEATTKGSVVLVAAQHLVWFVGCWCWCVEARRLFGVERGTELKVRHSNGCHESITPSLSSKARVIVSLVSGCIHFGWVRSINSSRRARTGRTKSTRREGMVQQGGVDWTPMIQCVRD